MHTYLKASCAGMTSMRDCCSTQLLFAWNVYPFFIESHGHSSAVSSMSCSAILRLELKLVQGVMSPAGAGWHRSWRPSTNHARTVGFWGWSWRWGCLASVWLHSPPFPRFHKSRCNLPKDSSFVHSRRGAIQRCRCHAPAPRLHSDNAMEGGIRPQIMPLMTDTGRCIVWPQHNALNSLSYSYKKRIGVYSTNQAVLSSLQQEKDARQGMMFSMWFPLVCRSFAAG